MYFFNKNLGEFLKVQSDEVLNRKYENSKSIKELINSEISYYINASQQRKAT